MRIASVQLATQNRPKADTVEQVLALLDEAKDSDLILLPELWPTGFYSYARYATDAETLDGPTVQALRRKARDLRAHLFTGSFVERDAGNLYNTALLVSPDGDVLARYRKMHLFSYRSQERQLLCPGKEAVVVPTPWGKAGLAICYDLRFPELFRKMIDHGAEYFLVASAWPLVRVESWILFNRARANENLAYLFSCNAAGLEGEQQCAGHSMFVDPTGKVIAQAGAAPTILNADVDMTRVAAIRADFPALEQRSLR